MGVEIDELGFDSEAAEVADAELAEVTVGAALISDIDSTAVDEEPMSTILFPAALIDTVLIAAELEEVTTGASVVKADTAAVDGSGTPPSTVIQDIEQSSSSSFWAMGAAKAPAKSKANTKDGFTLVT